MEGGGIIRFPAFKSVAELLGGQMDGAAPPKHSSEAPVLSAKHRDQSGGLRYHGHQSCDALVGTHRPTLGDGVRGTDDQNSAYTGEVDDAGRQLGRNAKVWIVLNLGGSRDGRTSCIRK